MLFWSPTSACVIFTHQYVCFIFYPCNAMQFQVFLTAAAQLLPHNKIDRVFVVIIFSLNMRCSCGLWRNGVGITYLVCISTHRIVFCIPDGASLLQIRIIKSCSSPRKTSRFVVVVAEMMILWVWNKKWIIREDTKNTEVSLILFIKQSCIFFSC